MDKLQRIVDSLERATKRSVAIHDPQGRILAYSAHQGHVDEVRTASILARRTPAESLAWSKSMGIEQATGPVRIPANAELGMASRICAPVRFEDRLVAFLWLLDADESLPEPTLEVVRAAAESAGLAIHRDQLMSEIERGRERELLRDLLADEPTLREHSADALVERKLLIAADRVVVLVVRPVRDRAGMARTDDALRAAVERALNDARATAPARQALQLVRHDHGLLLLSLSEAATAPGGMVERIAAALHTAMESGLQPHSGWKAVVGVGDTREDLADAHTTYRRARQAAEVASLLESFGPVVAWRQLGVYQTLVDLPLEQLKESSLHPGLVKLMASREPDIWLRTLECYFDLGCDARASAEALNVQRGSMYHRLHRIEELAGVDLRKGDDRLALHLGLKLARLAGLLNR